MTGPRRFLLPPICTFLLAVASSAQQPPEPGSQDAASVEERDAEAGAKLESLCAEGLVPRLACTDSPTSAVRARKPRRLAEACESGLISRQWCLEGPPVPARLARDSREPVDAELRRNCLAGLLPLRFCPADVAELVRDRADGL